MAFWAHPSPAGNAVASPIIASEEEEGLDVDLQAHPRKGGAVVTDEQRKLAIAHARLPHSGKVSFDIRILIVVGVVGIVCLVLFLFFRNMRKARAIIHQQIMAKQTAVTLVAQLDALLPRQQVTTGHPPSADSFERPQGGKPAITITPATHPFLARALASVDRMGSMVDNNRADVWVIDRHAWVYADSRNPARAVHPQTQTRPNFNLFRLNTVHGDKGGKAPPNVGAAIVQAAEHGPGLVNFLVPAQGVSGAAVSSVSVFVQAVPGTEFLVVVKVGHRSDNDAVRPVSIATLPSSASASALAPHGAAASAASASAAVPITQARVVPATGLPPPTAPVVSSRKVSHGGGSPPVAAAKAAPRPPHMSEPANLLAAAVASMRRG